MKKLFVSILAAATMCFGAAGITPSWIRHCAIAPDGQNIAFTWQGDLYLVDVHGGPAIRLTSNPAYESDPVWSEDGQYLYFSSTREDSKDIWKIGVGGGAPVRVTTFGGKETPLTSHDGELYFQADIQPDPVYAGFPGDPQVYAVSEKTGAVRQYVPFPMCAMSFNRIGMLLYEDYKGYEDPLRKHHTSSVTRDVWKYLPKRNSFKQLSTFAGEDRNPVFASDGKTYYYLSEKSGCMNVWRADVNGADSTAQMTFFKNDPVRSLSCSRTDVLAFSCCGELYTFKSGEEPAKLRIDIVKDTDVREEILRNISAGARNIAVSPNGKEIAVVAYGDVFVTSIDYKTTRRITSTPEQERCVSFSEDGRALYFDSERGGSWGIFKVELSNDKDKYFCYSFDFAEKRLTKAGETCLQPKVSPDGKSLAYLKDRTRIVVRDLKSGKEKVVLKDALYSYADGDISFEWSPCSRYILTDYQAGGGWNNPDVAVIEVKTGKVTDLTRSGYSDGMFRWAMDGKAMTWTSDKKGYRSHGSWGAQDDIYLMFFDPKAYSDFLKTKEDNELDKLLANDEAKDSKADKKKGSKKHAKDSTKTPDPLVFEGVEDRIVHLTPVSGNLGDYYLTPDGKTLYYVMELEKGRDLCKLDVKKGDVKVVKKGFIGRLYPDKDGKNLFVLGRGVQKMDLSSDKITEVEFESEQHYRPADERAYIFEHVWRQVNDKFYDKDIHGIDWKAIHDNYAKFLPSINNNYDFQELLSEMLGELNGSHTGARYYASSKRNVGHLGVLFDAGYTGEGLKIAEILPGSVLQHSEPSVKAGDLILAIDGKKIEAGTQWYDALCMKAGKRICVSLRIYKDNAGRARKSDSAAEELKTVYVKAVSNDSDALYQRWVRRNEATVEKLSKGRVGYVHVEGMDSPSFREVYSKALGKYRNCEALIVDTRHNGGGWLHDDLASFLDGKAYIEYRPRGQYIGTDPYNKWCKPSCVLVGEDNYSDACGFPYVYKTLGIGKLIGAPVPGTMTAVWWETQIDPTLVFGIPQVTSWGLKENRPLENMQVEPDIKVYNDPKTMIEGRDIQLEAAVEEMLKQINGKK